MRLICLGTTGYHPNERRHTACYMLPELGVVFDAGTGAFRIGPHLRTDALEFFLSHAHLDHIIGLTYLFDILAARPSCAVKVHGTEKTLAAIQSHLLAEVVFPTKLPCEYVPLADETRLPLNARMTHFPLDHPGGSCGFRLDWPGGSLAYVTDTTATADASYLSLIRGVDLLIHECNFPDTEHKAAVRTGHSCTSDVARVAADSQVGRLLLCHLAPHSDDLDPAGLETARAIFPQTLLAEDNLSLEV
jgi:ribonuclease Z